MEKKNFNKKILILSSNFYHDISKNLQEGVLNVLKNEKIDFELKIINGSLEIPFFLEKYKRQFLGYIIIGCVIKGETDHYHYICDAVVNGIMNLTLRSATPILFGVLTCQNKKLAQDRSGDDKKTNKGYELGIMSKNILFEEDNSDYFIKT